MRNELRIATHLGPFGSGGDRYNLKGYKSAVGVEERICQAGKVVGLSGVELNFRGLVNEESAPSIKSLIDQNKLTCVNVSMNVWGDSRWGLGSLIHPEASIRREARDLIIAGMQTALPTTHHVPLMESGHAVATAIVRLMDRSAGRVDPITLRRPYASIHRPMRNNIPAPTKRNLLPVMRISYVLYEECSILVFEAQMTFILISAPL